MNGTRCRAFAEIRSAEKDGDELVLQGIASTGDLDRKGGFIDQESLWSAASRAKSLPIFWQHDWDAPIGRTTRMGRGDDALLIEARIGKDFDITVTKGFSGVVWSINNIRQMIMQGIVNAFSIGFDADKRPGTRSEDPPTYFVTDIMETSVVTVPANDKTLFSFQRSMILDPDTERPRYMTVAPSDRTNSRFELLDPDEDNDLAEYAAALRMLTQAVRGVE